MTDQRRSRRSDAGSDARVIVKTPVPPVSHTLWLALPDSDEFMVRWRVVRAWHYHWRLRILVAFLGTRTWTLYDHIPLEYCNDACRIWSPMGAGRECCHICPTPKRCRNRSLAPQMLPNDVLQPGHTLLMRDLTRRLERRMSRSMSKYITNGALVCSRCSIPHPMTVCLWRALHSQCGTPLRSTCITLS